MRESLNRSQLAEGDGRQDQAHASAGDGADLRRYLTVLWRRRRWVVALPVLALGAATAYLSAAVPVYEARVKLLIESQSPNVVNFREVLEQNTAKLDYYETQLGILRSRTLARKTLDALRLWNDPGFVVPPPSKLSGLLQAFPVKHVVPPTPQTRKRDETAAQSYAIDTFLKRLTITYRAANRLLDAGFQSTSPRQSADVVNTLARVYIDQDLEFRLRATRDASDWLNARLMQQRKHVEDSEMALQRYREANSDVAVSESQNVTVQRLTELSTAATRAKAERIDLEALYKQLQAPDGTSAGAVALPASLSNSFFHQLKLDLAVLRREQARLLETFGQRHPEVIKVESAIQNVEEQLRGEIARIADGVNTQLTAVRTKEHSLTAALDAQERLALALNRKSIQYGVLQREATSNRQIFEALLERAKQTEISSQLKITNIQVVDPAEIPLKPQSPQPQLIFMLALMLGLPLGIGAAIVVDYVDDRIATADQIKSTLGVKFLGATPVLPGRARKADVQPMGYGVPRELSDAVRGIRAKLLTEASPEGPSSLLVASTARGEGRTVIAANLAAALGQAGRRVLIVDADLRRSRVHQTYGVPLEPGLADVLRGAVPVAAAIRPSDVKGVSVLAAGAAGGTPGDLLDSPKFAEALAAVRHDFDWIVVDSPAVSVASDALSLAHTVTAVLLVVRAQTSRTRHVRQALDHLEATGAKVAGAVLTHVPAVLSGHVARLRSSVLPGALAVQRTTNFRYLAHTSCNVSEQTSVRTRE